MRNLNHRFLSRPLQTKRDRYLAGVCFEADESSLVLASFDYEVSARCQVPADVEEGGVVLVSGRLLAEIAKSLPAKPVNLEVEGTKVAVSCGSAHFSLASDIREQGIYLLHTNKINLLTL